MSESSLLTISEADANVPTLAIYTDIKSTMGVALVNLIWRHLAVKPSVLQWCWQSLKPHYVNGAVPAAAWLLRDALEIPDLEAFSPTEWEQLQLQVPNLSELDAVLGTYERGNAQNLVAMCYLLACLVDGNPRPTDIPTLNTAQQAAELSDRVRSTIPPLPTLDSLSADVQSAISAMTEVWVPKEHRGFTPSVFRHIAWWPDILPLYQTRLTALRPDSLSMLSHQAVERAGQLAANLEGEGGGEGRKAAKLPALTKDDQLWLRGALVLFIHGMISRGVIIVPAMRAVLTTAPERTNC